MHESSHGFAFENFCKVSVHVHVEHINGKVVFFAEGGGCEIHDSQTACLNFVKGNFVELGGGFIFLGVGGVNSVNASAFKHNVCLYFNAAKC